MPDRAVDPDCDGGPVGFGTIYFPVKTTTSYRTPSPPRIEPQVLRPLQQASPSPPGRHEDVMATHRFVSPHTSTEPRRKAFSDTQRPGNQEHRTPTLGIRDSTISANHQTVPVLGPPKPLEGSTPELPKTDLPVIESTENVDQPQRSSFDRVAKSSSIQYTPLRSNEIRLIELDTAGSPSVKCRMTDHFPLHAAPPYTAISYAWGDGGDQCKIQLDGIDVYVTTSLCGALMSLQDVRWKSVLIWADALCIDQHNLAEKSEQLRLVPAIYQGADSVAIWLGPEKDNSTIATELLEEVVSESGNTRNIQSIIGASNRRPQFHALISLFERSYWDRLWVVQEIFNAEDISVYCGSTKIPWSVYYMASRIFLAFKADIEANYPGGRFTGHCGTLYNHLSYAQILAYGGPGNALDRHSFEDPDKLNGQPIDVLFGIFLDIARGFRRKLSGEPRDKIFGILGVLPERVRCRISVDYTLSVKDVYTHVVDILLRTTGRLDVICECIHFPRHTNSFNLPSWVPDWSYMPDVKALGASYNFSADGNESKAVWVFKGERQNKLQISAVHLGVIKSHGIAVGTLCKSADYLMAFLHWRTVLLGTLRIRKADQTARAKALETFCLTLSLGRGPTERETSRDWMEICHHLFAYLIADRLPDLPLDRELASHISTRLNVGDYEAYPRVLYEYFGSSMMGRCFFVTDEGLMGMGSGFLTLDDIIVVPFGCSTPIILRPEGDEFRMVGDAYVSSYMTGKAVESYAAGRRKLGEYVLH